MHQLQYCCGGQSRQQNWCQTKKIGTVWSKLTEEKRREYVSVSLAQNFLKACNNANNIIVAGKAEISECL